MISFLITFCTDFAYMATKTTLQIHVKIYQTSVCGHKIGKYKCGYMPIVVIVMNKAQ